MAKVIILPSAAKNIVSEIIKVSDLQRGDFLWLVAEDKEENEIEKIRDAITPLLKPGINAVVSSFKLDIQVLKKAQLRELYTTLGKLLAEPEPQT